MLRALSRSPSGAVANAGLRTRLPHTVSGGVAANASGASSRFVRSHNAKTPDLFRFRFFQRSYTSAEAPKEAGSWARLARLISLFSIIFSKN
jgi:hypothetical protein